MNVKTVSPASPEIDSRAVVEESSQVQRQAEPMTYEAKLPVNGSVVPDAIAVEYELSPTSVPSEASLETVPVLQTEVLRYDPVAIMAKYRKAPFQVLGRFLNIVLPSIGFALNLWLDRVLGRTERNQRHRAIQLRKILTKLGPAYIKVGQALSTRPDLVPTIFLEELALLQDQLPPFPNELAYQFIEEELGGRPDQIYAELTPQPVAAASLGQVYKGKLKTGETVAVKVQRPGLARRIALDVYILRSLSMWIQKNFKQVRSDLVAIMDEFATRIFEEMDYTLEGRNAERFSKLYGHLEDIYVPRIYWEYTGRRVLTMEWITGTKADQYGSN
jgi:predicted unusual protein kinase regulating ubiquinone biosynthesis (AarF/ABC1/UbiB family)